MSEIDLRGHGFRVGGLHHSILKMLVTEPLPSRVLFEGIPESNKRFLSLPEFVTDVTSVMAMDGYLHYEKELWTLTDNGRAMLNFLEYKPPAPAVLTVAGKQRYNVPAGIYDGAELRGTCLRKGAYNFLALPSLYGNTLVDHPTAHIYAGEFT